MVRRDGGRRGPLREFRKEVSEVRGQGRVPQREFRRRGGRRPGPDRHGEAVQPVQSGRSRPVGRAPDEEAETAGAQLERDARTDAVQRQQGRGLAADEGHQEETPSSKDRLPRGERRRVVERRGERVPVDRAEPYDRLSGVGGQPARPPDGRRPLQELSLQGELDAARRRSVPGESHRILFRKFERQLEGEGNFHGRAISARRWIDVTDYWWI
mmetsp:Transcript_47414/g.88042  ORF Transcript_47414/g.88042 Transcript_47414/m.88042 type:complete len:213 (-) Transcript_47414:689-1327(-)